MPRADNTSFVLSDLIVALHFTIARANNPNDLGKIPQCTTKEIVTSRHDMFIKSIG
jgi:hypothetical protein